jgi:hypothetical protein
MRSLRRWPLLFALTALLAIVPATVALAGGDERETAPIRQVTAQFQYLPAAIASGYAQFLTCLSNPGVGAMGQHYVSGTLLNDGALDVQHPEALLYEQQPGGQMRLVGVEYIVFVSDWDAAHGEPPSLLGQTLHITDNPALGVPPFYALHVWAWKHNPAGTFADWNPDVACPAAAEA